jgi:hypothetical protein
MIKFEEYRLEPVHQVRKMNGASQAEKLALEDFVKGHDFSRAGKTSRIKWALAPEGMPVRCTQALRPAGRPTQLLSCSTATVAMQALRVLPVVAAHSYQSVQCA